MAWLPFAIAALFCWAIFGFFSKPAMDVHGFNVNIFFYAAMYIVVAVVLVFFTKEGTSGISKLTPDSAKNAVIMVVTGVGGLLFFTVAMKFATTKESVNTAIFVAGCFPIASVLLGRFFFGAILTPQQWLGVALGGAGLVLVNWK